MKAKSVFSLFVLLIISGLAQATTASELWLQVGQSKRLLAPANAKVRVGKRGVIQVVDQGTHLQVIALKTGATTLSTGSSTHSVYVTAPSQKEFIESLRGLLKSRMGLKLESMDGHFVITGQLLRTEDWWEIADLARRLEGRYEFRAHPLFDVAQEALQKFRKLAKDQSIPLIRFTAHPQLTVHLPKTTPGLRQRTEDVFQPYGIRVQTEDSDLTLEPLVRTKVILAEVLREKGMDWGIQWPSSYQAKVVPKELNTDGLLVTLKALETKGGAQVLATPNLLCRSGAEARFHAGGEFPVRIFSRIAQSVVWKKHGVLLRVKPKADFHGAISLELETEISLLDQANAVDGIPALKTNTVISHFDLPGRRTIALSGLLRDEWGSNQEGLPLLSQIPILGALFSSQNFRRRKSEFVIFVTPEIYSPDSSEDIEMPKGWASHDL